MASTGGAKSTFAHHLAARQDRRVHHRHRARGIAAVEVHARPGREEIERQVEVGPAEPYLVRGHLLVGPGKDQAREHRAPLLRRAGLVVAQDLQPVDERRPAEERVHRDDAGPADAREVDVVRPLQPDAGRGLRDRVGRERRRRGPPVPRARLRLDRHERGAVPAEAREVLVAGRGVDPRLRAELGLDPVERHAVGERSAVAAALADLLVDHDEAVRRRQLLAASGGAGARWRTGRRGSAR